MQKIEQMEIKMTDISEREGRLKASHNNQLVTVNTIEDSKGTEKKTQEILGELNQEMKFLRSH